MPRVVTDNESVFLEICIPTCNRSKQLERLLTILEGEISAALIDTTIRITISNNCSSDDTQAMLQSHPFRDKVVIRTNSENIGALRNIWGLYEIARCNYVWLLSDDDIPKPGSVYKILDTLIRYEPTVLTFEFEQPPGSYKRWHGNQNGIEEITDLRHAIPNILVLGKLSKYVVNTRHLKKALINVYHLSDTGYGWLAVILETIKLSDQKKIVIYHDFLSGCDDKYTELFDGLTPQFWDDYLLLLDHEIVKVSCSEYAKRYRYRHYSYMVLIIYAVLAGIIKSSNNQVFMEKGKQLPFHISYFRNPFVFLQWFCLRIEIPASPIVCRMAEYPGKIMRHCFSLIGRQDI